MITLYLVRHGETKENVANILQGHMPGELTERGIEQARQLCKKLQSVRFDALVCSDLKRCVDTAAILNEPHGLTPEYTPLLRERDWGEHTGQNILAGRIQIGPTAEALDKMYERASVFLKHMAEQHDGETVLVVSHGLFCRVLIGAATCKLTRDVARMDNAEVRILRLETPLKLKPVFDKNTDEASAN